MGLNVRGSEIWATTYVPPYLPISGASAATFGFGRSGSLGAWLDPMADKLLLVTTFVVLTVPGTDLVNRFPLWLTILVITRDVVIVTTVAIVTAVMGVRTFKPSVFGKIATGVYLVTCVVIMWFNFLERPSVLVDIGVWTSLAITLISGFHYIWHAARIINAPHARN